jgi:hypothetical protein
MPIEQLFLQEQLHPLVYLPPQVQEQPRLWVLELLEIRKLQLWQGQ